MKDVLFQIGNTFDNNTQTIGHAKRVWRRIYKQLPGGFVIKNVSDFSSAKVIKAGSAVYYDTTLNADSRDIKVYTWAAVASASGNINSLNIIGFLQEDVVIQSNETVATGNIVVEGELYGYMLGDTVSQAATNAAALKGMTQKNGLQITILD